MKQMSNVVDLMRQQIEWSMRSESGRREQDLGTAEVLEARMRTMEVRLESVTTRPLTDLTCAESQNHTPGVLSCLPVSRTCCGLRRLYPGGWRSLWKRASAGSRRHSARCLRM